MKKAFTIIESLVVVAIIALLIAIFYPVFANVQNNQTQSSNFTVITDEYVGGQHIQIIEDNSSHIRIKLVNDQVVSETELNAKPVH
jgi:prepilin-type N-terminal cleavage/methylation domain-containing protein